MTVADPPPSTPRQTAARQRGVQAEEFACQYLRERGLKLLGRNYRCRRGELDLVMRQGDTLVFVEVRYRNSTRFGTPAETVTKVKQARLIAAAQSYLQQNARFSRYPARFDVVTIAGDGDDRRIEWITDAFAAG